MTTFNHGDKVTCTVEHEGEFYNITDAKISIDDDKTPFICHNVRNCDDGRADNMFGYSCGWLLKTDFTDYRVTNLKLAVRKVRDADVGDLVVKDANICIVIDSLPNSVLLSYPDAHSSS